MRTRNLFLTVLAFILTISAGEAQTKRPSVTLQHGAHRIGKRMDADMQRWREYGLGQFLHWGVYAVAGGHWNGKYYAGAAEWIRSWNEMPHEDYDNLYRQFNPTGFNAAQWAKQAAEMGAKYMIITTKHHDGFCLWHSKYTNYTVARTPFKRDIVKELVDAYTKEGIDVYLYFSVIDWNHPGYRAILREEDREVYETFKQFTRNQLIELLTAFPKVKGLWFDGTWDKAWVEQAAFADALESELRALHPGLIIGSRFRADEYGKRHYDSNGDLMGDYEQGWERNLPESFDEVRHNDWDCVMTVPENQWGYHSDWRGYVKTSHDLINMLVKCVSMNGNFVLNFGPDGKGNIRQEETKLAKEIGEWMKINGEAIYGCSHVDLKKQDWGYFTRKQDKIYMTVFHLPVNGLLTLETPKDGNIPSKAWLLSDKRTLEIISAGRNKNNHRLYHIALPEGFSPGAPFVVVLETDKDGQNDGNAYQPAKI
ncbi:MAG: alpha-L-fucosidase [Bacteroidales bacterium]|nr:alpha-L-fucosidase [Bacteroidales bacterium]